MFDLAPDKEREMNINTNEIRRLFAVLYANRRSEGTCCLMALPSKSNKIKADAMSNEPGAPPLPLPMRTTTQWYARGEGKEMLTFINAANHTRGVHLRQALFDPDTARATAEAVLEMTHLWIDVDTRNFCDVYKLGDGETKALLIEKLENFKFPPTLIVNSGGGIHAYWKLAQSVLRDEPSFALAVEALAHLQRVFSGDKQAINASLRIPGTLNLNYDPPRLAQIVRCDEAASAPVEDLLEFARTHRQVFGEDDASGLPPEQLDLIAVCERAGAWISGRVTTQRTPEEWDRIARNLQVDGYRTQSVLALAGRFCRMGVPVSMQVAQIMDKLHCTLPEAKVKRIVASIARKHNETAETPVQIDLE